MPGTSYAIAIGSNRRHGRHGAPDQVIRAAIATLTQDEGGIALLATSPIIRTAALGPAGRSFANAAALIRTELAPPALLARLKAIERAFGRRPGRRWGPRVLDLDIILWSGGQWHDKTLTVPHDAFAARDFVLRPLVSIIAQWRDPRSGFTVRQLQARLKRRTPVDRGPPRP